MTTSHLVHLPPPHCVTPAHADLVIDTRALERSAASLRSVAERLGSATVGDGPGAVQRAAAFTGNERLAFHLRLLAEQAGSDYGALILQSRHAEAALVTVAGAFAEIERITAARVSSPASAEQGN